MTDTMTLTRCVGCATPTHPDLLHTPHDPGCPFPELGWCACTTTVCPNCCPDCNHPTNHNKENTQ